MCGIIGFTRRTISRGLALEGFNRTLSRGPDMSQFVECGKGWLGFHRLAIMGLNANGMQPFRLDGDMCVCNGELYGFRPIKTELVGMGYRWAYARSTTESGPPEAWPLPARRRTSWDSAPG